MGEAVASQNNLWTCLPCGDGALLLQRNIDPFGGAELERRFLVMDGAEPLPCFVSESERCGAEETSPVPLHYPPHTHTHTHTFLFAGMLRPGGILAAITWISAFLLLLLPLVAGDRDPAVLAAQHQHSTAALLLPRNSTTGGEDGSSVSTTVCAVPAATGILAFSSFGAEFLLFPFGAPGVYTHSLTTL